MNEKVTTKEQIDAAVKGLRIKLLLELTPERLRELFPKKDAFDGCVTLTAPIEVKEISIEELEEAIAIAKENGAKVIDFDIQYYDNEFESIQLECYPQRVETDAEYNSRLESERNKMINKQADELYNKMYAELRDFNDYQRLKKKFE